MSMAWVGDTWQRVRAWFLSEAARRLHGLQALLAQLQQSRGSFVMTMLSSMLMSDTSLRDVAAGHWSCTSTVWWTRPVCTTHVRANK